MKRYYCTYFDKAYLVRGLALITSLITNEKNEFTIFVVCLDEITRVILKKLAIRNIELIPLHEIEHNDAELLTAKNNRTLVEYYWTLTPTVILRIMERRIEVDLLTYLDADMYFFSSPDPIFQEFASRSILIHEHRFPTEYKYLDQHGTYNVGMLSFRKDNNGYEALSWWRVKCNEWCYARVEDGKFGDQLYLEDWLDRFSGVHVLEHIGGGVAPWNLIQYDFSNNTDGSVFVNNVDVIFFHFHAFDFFSDEIMVLARYGYPISEKVVRYCYHPYVMMLSNLIKIVHNILPDFNFGLNNSNTIRDENAFIAPRDILHKLPPEMRLIELDSKWICCCLNQIYT